MIRFERIGTGGNEPLPVVPSRPCRRPEYLGDLCGLSSERDLIDLHPRGTQVTGGLSRGWWIDSADLIAVADAIGMSRFDVLGHSAGTRLVIAAAVQHPDRVDSLVLVTPSAAWLTGAAHDGAAIAARRHEPLIRAALASMGHEPTNDEEFQASLVQEAPAGYARWGLREQQHTLLGGTRYAAVKAWFRDIPSNAPEQILRARRSRISVIDDDEDILSGVEPVRSYARALNALLTLIGNCGFYPWIEQP